MNITDVKIRSVNLTGSMKAVVSVTIDNEIAIHDMKIIEGPERLFLAMPSRKMFDGSFRDIAHPINAAAREKLEKTVLAKFEEMKETAAHANEPEEPKFE
ncbi:MAG: septation regulator SpoVG [Oscillospiraceae bacterium]|nr:septation regulator SpoVG [Oscillospiraceae bacterium]